jgi:hypothetical protein
MWKRREEKRRDAQGLTEEPARENGREMLNEERQNRIPDIGQIQMGTGSKKGNTHSSRIAP